MGMLQQLGTGQGYGKVGLLGFPKSGKTWTASLLACGIREQWGDKRPIAIFDTEGSAEYVAPLIKKATGLPPLGLRSRSFADLLTVARECEKDAAVLIVDSITHIWRDLTEAYMKAVNEKRVQRGLNPRARMEMLDIMGVKEKWSVWPDFFLNSKLHIIICGRAGFEWDMVENQETGRKELTKTGVKMKVESEFGFEPSLLVEMERVQTLGEKTTLQHRATIIGDRFGAIDGTQTDNPTYAFFKPHFDLLKPGAHAPVATEITTKVEVDEEGNPEWHRERRQRAIFAEEIQGLLVAAWPGQSGAEKQNKAAALHEAFDTYSWTAVENMESEKLHARLKALPEIIAAMKKSEVKTEKKGVVA